MKHLLSLLLAGAAMLGFTACQNGGSSHSSDKFSQSTHRTFNPETGTFEQSPPYGKESNKSGTNPGQ
jgi:hypothetical protein